MDQADFKRQFVRSEVKVDDSYGKVHSYIEFGNVTYWFADDRQDADRNLIPENQSLAIYLDGLKEFAYFIGEDARFYYGFPPAGDTKFLVKTKHVFGGNRVFTKEIRYVRHYLTNEEVSVNTREIFTDAKGTYVRIPKCNFDVEIAVDAVRNMDKYDTFCLFSSDADFVRLAHFLKKKGKKFILVKGGPIDKSIREAADLIINAQDIKKYIGYLRPKLPKV
ncbi:MAG: hypothetical protein UX06_C0001G0001 [Candidatus Giovannonibacteria bacterium GW2011_GWA2_45_21]|uniref:NYN domain-containing protein n=1 Tax=Candidatus Giovannonibacteria bacterium GW2011_GWA2_45_21 TaxID=1618649 RepID=A0A0G1Q9E1_9BACT|nr:MAG: hypothetical protein UX06_C0001G0001 [Candidatus Giovannonibacteria bacterium GW2011_GWA2_45_21]